MLPNGSAMISAAQKSSGFPATHEAKAYGFVFFFFILNAKSIRFCDILKIHRLWQINPKSVLIIGFVVISSDTFE